MGRVAANRAQGELATLTDGGHGTRGDLLFEVAGIPQPAGSKRAFRRGDRIIVADANANARPWKDSVIHAARSALSCHAPSNALLVLGGPLSLSIEFRMPRPRGHYNKKGLKPSAPHFHTVRPDATKLLRCAEDAITESGMWHDDAQVAEQHVTKIYAEQPGMTVRVSSLNPSRR